jgi:cation transport ATPase
MTTGSGDSGARRVDSTSSSVTHHETEPVSTVTHSESAPLTREVQPEPREVRQETVIHEQERQHPVDVPERPVNVSVPAERRDQVRWGPVWAGLVVALSTFLLLELLSFGLRWLTVGADNGNTRGWVSGLLGLIAFFLGGLVAGATAMWKHPGTGLLHGIMVWALGVVSIVLIATLGGGALFGSVADTLGQVSNLNRPDLSNVDAGRALDTARSAARWGTLGLLLSLAAAALGGLTGAKMWPRNKDADRSVQRV